MYLCQYLSLLYNKRYCFALTFFSKSFSVATRRALAAAERRAAAADADRAAAEARLALLEADAGPEARTLNPKGPKP